MIRGLKTMAALAATLLLAACQDDYQPVEPPKPGVSSPPEKVEKVSRNRISDQIIHVAFDGSRSLSVWQDTLDFALENDVKYTFFVVGTHLLADDLATLYDPPRYKPGRSDVSFGGTKDEVASRLQMLRRAYREGHEIAAHANGHWDGSTFTYDEWASELAQFKKFLTQAYEINGIENPDPAEWRRLTESVIGFRAPLLAQNAAMYQALADAGYKYDTSQVLRLVTAPDYQENGVVIYPLHSLPTPRGRTITMDYNFYYLDAGRRDGAGQNMLSAYQDHLNLARGMGNAPIQIGHHFSRWNGGQYWWALKQFIAANCDTPGTRCMTFADRYRLETR